MAFFAAPSSAALSNATLQRLQQRLALGVVRDGRRQVAELLEVGDLARQGLAVCVRQRRPAILVVPFLGRFVQRLVVLVEFVARVAPAASASRALPSGA